MLFKNKISFPIILFSVFILLSLLASFSVNIVHAQVVPWVEWIRSYGDEFEATCYSVVGTSDGGYALGGYVGSLLSGSGPYGRADYLLIKTDSLGNIVWNKTYVGTDYDVCHAMVGTFDGGYALAGSSWSFSNGLMDFWLVKTDSLGNVEWNQSYGGENTEEAYSLVQTSDEGFALAGYYYTDMGGNDFWVVKTDSQGSMEWTYGGAGYAGIAYSIIETSEGRLAVAGTNGLTVIDSVGLGFRAEGANGVDCRGVIETDDGGFLLACRIKSIDSAGHELGVIKVDSEGKQVWNRTYGEGYANAIISTNDGGFALVGYTYQGYGNDDFLLVKCDNSGNEQWRRFYGTPEHERAYSAVETSDGFALAGYREDWTHGHMRDFWLVKTNLQGIPEFPGYILVLGALTVIMVAGISYKKKMHPKDL